MQLEVTTIMLIKTLVLATRPRLPWTAEIWKQTQSSKAVKKELGKDPFWVSFWVLLLLFKVNTS